MNVDEHRHHAVCKETIKADNSFEYFPHLGKWVEGGVVLSFPSFFFLSLEVIKETANIFETDTVILQSTRTLDGSYCQNFVGRRGK